MHVDAPAGKVCPRRGCSKNRPRRGVSGGRIKSQGECHQPKPQLVKGCFYHRLNVGETQGDPPYASEGGGASLVKGSVYHRLNVGVTAGCPPLRQRGGGASLAEGAGIIFTLPRCGLQPYMPIYTSARQKPLVYGGCELRRVLTPAKGGRGWRKGGTLGWPLTFAAGGDHQ